MDQARDTPQHSGNRKQGNRARILPSPPHSAGELGPSGLLGTRDNREGAPASGQRQGQGQGQGRAGQRGGCPGLAAPRWPLAAPAAGRGHVPGFPRPGGEGLSPSRGVQLRMPSIRRYGVSARLPRQGPWTVPPPSSSLSSPYPFPTGRGASEFQRRKGSEGMSAWTGGGPRPAGAPA